MTSALERSSRQTGASAHQRRCRWRKSRRPKIHRRGRAKRETAKYSRPRGRPSTIDAGLIASQRCLEDYLLSSLLSTCGSCSPILPRCVRASVPRLRSTARARRNEAPTRLRSRGERLISEGLIVAPKQHASLLDLFAKICTHYTFKLAFIGGGPAPQASTTGDSSHVFQARKSCAVVVGMLVASDALLFWPRGPPNGKRAASLRVRAEAFFSRPIRTTQRFAFKLH